MAPSAIYEPVAPKQLSPKQLLKVENMPTAYRNNTWKRPVADDYMYAFKYNFPLPTTGDDSDVLDFTEEDEAKRGTTAEQFLQKFALVIQSRDSKAFADLFLYSGESDKSSGFTDY
jgi:hypothetical protein